MSGTLFVVGTPIGNLEDLTFRALRTLKEVQAIAAEDTRRTSKLLAHYQIRKPLVSIREHNEGRETPRLIHRLASGESIALVSDAGTPGIADPGARLVRAAHEAGTRVVPIPGASAVATALSASGFPADQFVFMGFPPRSGSARTEWFSRLAADDRLTVVFEAPHRIHRTIDELGSLLVNRRIVIWREMTKVFESKVINPINSINEPIPATGEFTIVIGPVDLEPRQTVSANDVVDMFGRLTNLAGLEEKLALRLTASAFLMKTAEVSKALKKHIISVKQQQARMP